MKFYPRVAVVAFTIAGVCSAAQNAPKFSTRLAPVPTDAPMKPNIAGLGSASATLNGSKITVTGTFDGLVTPATNAHLHMGMAPGVRGPSVFDLTVTTAKSGTLSGSFDLNAAQVEAFRQGHFYVVINSEKAPEGNLWGWLMPSK